MLLHVIVMAPISDVGQGGTYFNLAFIGIFHTKVGFNWLSGSREDKK